MPQNEGVKTNKGSGLHACRCRIGAKGVRCVRVRGRQWLHEALQLCRLVDARRGQLPALLDSMLVLKRQLRVQASVVQSLRQLL